MATTLKVDRCARKIIPVAIIKICKIGIDAVNSCPAINSMILSAKAIVPNKSGQIIRDNPLNAF